MKTHVLAPLLSLTLIAGCASPPTIAERNTYRPPRWEYMPNLAKKAALHEQQCEEMINEAGMLCYWQRVPWDRLADGRFDAASERYLSSHDLADVPAWQGYLMAALAFKGAIAQRDRDAQEVADVNAQLQVLAEWYTHFFDVTGEPGLIGRTLVTGYSGAEPLAFMTEDDLDRAHWRRSKTTGEWWLDDLAKGHLNLAVIGLAVPLALDRHGELNLDGSTRRALTAALMPIVKRLVENEYVVLNAEGEPTRFSDITPNSFLFPNGFQRIVAWQVLASAAPYDDDIRDEYEEKLDEWKSGLVWSMESSGDFARARGRWHTAAQISNSDSQQLALAAMSFLLQEEREEHRAPVLDALDAWWDFMQYELNAPFTLVYAHYYEDGPGRKRSITAPIIQELRDFPPVKHPSRFENEEESIRLTEGVVQPIWNRPVDVNYWKANAFEEVLETETPNTRVRYAPMDYLLAYWMGRYFGLVPEE